MSILNYLRGKGYTEEEIDYAIYYKVVEEGIKNVIFYGIATLIILQLGKVNFWLGTIPAAVNILVAISSFLQGLPAVFIGIILMPAWKLLDKLQGKKSYAWYAQGSVSYKFVSSLFRGIQDVILLYFAYQLFLGIRSGFA